MKIIAVAQHGTKKDFIDLAAFFHAGWNLEAMFRAVETNFRDVRYNKMHLLKSITYFLIILILVKLQEISKRRISECLFKRVPSCFEFSFSRFMSNCF